MWVWRPESMYSAVPPPEFQGGPSGAGASTEREQEEKSKPANVQKHQWKVRNRSTWFINTLFEPKIDIYDLRVLGKEMKI